MTAVTVREITDPAEKQRITRKILEALPAWFADEKGREDYIAQSADAPYAAVYNNGVAVGMAALKTTTPAATEILVMGVLPEYHRSGAGRALVEWAKAKARTQGSAYLHLKTLDESVHYPPYEITRAFYTAMGFSPLECLPTLWDAENPCLIMIQKL